MKPKSTKARTSELLKPYKPTARECAVLNAYLDKQESSAPRLDVREKNGKFEIDPDHPEKVVGNVLLMEAIGAKDFDFLYGFLKQLSNAGTQGRTTDRRGLNFMPSDHGKFFEKLSEKLSLTFESKILDTCCGNGQFSLGLADKNKKSVAIDNSSGMLSRHTAPKHHISKSRHKFPSASSVINQRKIRLFPARGISLG